MESGLCRSTWFLGVRQRLNRYEIIHTRLPKGHVSLAVEAAIRVISAVRSAR